VEGDIQRQQWMIQAAFVGFVAGVISTAALVTVGLMAKWPYMAAGRELQLVPSAIGEIVGSAGTAIYMLIRTSLYMVAGVAAFALARMSNRFPALLPGVLLVIIGLEFAFVGAVTLSESLGRITEMGWRALLVAHVVGDAFLAIAVFRAYPALRATLHRAYEE